MIKSGTHDYFEIVMGTGFYHCSPHGVAKCIQPTDWFSAFFNMTRKNKVIFEQHVMYIAAIRHKMYRLTFTKIPY